MRTTLTAKVKIAKTKMKMTIRTSLSRMHYDWDILVSPIR